MKPAELTVHRIDVDSIRPFIHRERNRSEFLEMVASMDREGLKYPIHVRDISDLPASERKRPNGGTYRYELIEGEGRTLAAKELGWKKIGAFIRQANQSEIVGRFLSENVIRRKVSWVEMAKLIKADLDAGMTRKEAAKAYCISEVYVAKLERILGKASPDIDLAGMSVSDAEAVVYLPKEDQSIVVSVLREDETLNSHNVLVAVARAKELREEAGALSQTALKQSLHRAEEELPKVLEKRKLKRLHFTLGPANIEALLANPEFAAALSAKVSTEAFLAKLANV